MGASEKPGLMELMGRAVNATNLATVEGREGNVERLAAMGMVQAEEDRAISQAAEGEIDPRASLGALLIRIKAGRGVGKDSVPVREAMQAVHMLIHWIRQQPSFKRWRLVSGEGMLQTFVQQSLAEWLNDTCTKCDGVEWTGVKRERTRTRRAVCRDCKGKRMVTRSREIRRGEPGKETVKTVDLRMACPSCCTKGIQFNELIGSINPKMCDECKGTGRRLANDGERARLLRVSERTYQQYWLRRFEWLRARLDRVEWTEKHLLQAQLERNTVRPVLRGKGA